MAKMYDVTAVAEYEKNGEKKARFTRVGVAFPFREGEGLSVLINEGISVTGKILIQPPKPKGEQGGGDGGNGIPFAPFGNV